MSGAISSSISRSGRWFAAPSTWSITTPSSESGNRALRYKTLDPRSAARPSIIRQRRGSLFSQLLNLIQSVAAFDIVTEAMLRQILAHLASPDEDFIEEANDGRFILTEKGERLVDSPEFYAAFRTTDQWEIVKQDDRKVGCISLSNALAVCSVAILFSLDHARTTPSLILSLKPNRSGR